LDLLPGSAVAGSERFARRGRVFGASVRRAGLNS
jgi:hypothetical protein